MNATLIYNLETDVLASAGEQARARHTTLAAVVDRQRRVMARNWQYSRAGRTPTTADAVCRLVVRWRMK